MYGKTLRNAIIDELDWDPSVDSTNIGVAVDGAVAVLTGHVANYAQKQAAERAVKRVEGVKAIAQEIEVLCPIDTTRTDEDIAQRALSVLEGDVRLPKDAVQLEVTNGWVTLSGVVNCECDRRTAEDDVRQLPEVIGVSNQVTLARRASAT
jgi:osmotically-inducible protein OsmY